MSAAAADRTSTVSPAGEVYRESVTEMLEAGFERRSRLEARGATLMTASASLIALIFGLTVLVTGTDPVLINTYAVYALIISLVAFVAAAVVGIVVQTHLRGYLVPDGEFLEKPAGTDAEWSRTADHAVRTDVSQKVRTLRSLRDGNRTSAKLVIIGLCVQLVAIVFLAISLGVELQSRLA